MLSPLYLLLWARIPSNKWSSPHSQQKNLKFSTWVQSQKWKNDLCCFQGKPFSIRVIQVYVPTSNVEEAEIEWFYEDLQGLLELTPKKRCPFHHRGLECKSSKSRDTWSKPRFGLGIQDEAGQRLRVLPRECTVHSKHPLSTTQEKILHMDITRWSILKSDWFIFFAVKDGEALYSHQK